MQDTYRAYFHKFRENDTEDVVQFVSNAEAEDFLLCNAPRLYCPDQTIEETFAFRTWTMRKHIKKTDAGFLITEFLVDAQLPWAGNYNIINAALTHHLNEFRWMKNADQFLDYIRFFITGEGSADATKSAFAYHTPALTAMYNYCKLTANEQYLIANADAFEKYFLFWEETHSTGNGLYWSIDDREGTEYTISGTTPELKMLKGFRPLMNACMYADARSLANIWALACNPEKEAVYLEKASFIRKKINEKMWDGDFYKAIHPLEQDLDTPLDYHCIPPVCNARELMGYIPWAFCVPEPGKEKAFEYLKDSHVFQAETGFTTADISHERFLFYQGKACTWNGNVWPYATSYAINAVIELLQHYEQSVISEADLYNFIHKYAQMHYSMENGKYMNFIDEVMLPFSHVWYARESARTGVHKPTGGPNRGKDYNHSTFIDLVLRGLCGIDTDQKELTLTPRVRGIWPWFKIENLSFHQNTYTVYYDEDGSVFHKGTGVIIEKTSF